MGGGRKNYGAAYRSVQEGVEARASAQGGSDCADTLLLRQHGKEICRDKSPQCYECPIKEMCAYPAKQVKMFSRVVDGNQSRHEKQP
jgi:hypothetical protein